jgi:hypothetical protein
MNYSSMPARCVLPDTSNVLTERGFCSAGVPPAVFPIDNVQKAAGRMPALHGAAERLVI